MEGAKVVGGGCLGGSRRGWKRVEVVGGGCLGGIRRGWKWWGRGVNLVGVGEDSYTGGGSRR